ncbi:MAG: SPW repeat protein [Proteobacteria bacterium]|nr:SPW repeat protein [Pseudomonadota bacterium]MBI3497074.1 SPW repeat protein [Pseudomonadota bacterium]
MAIGKFSRPEQWEDWLNLALGIWLSVSPWALQFANDETVTTNAVVVGLGLVLFQNITLTAFRVWEEWVNVVLGVWLVVSPWVLGIVALVPTANVAIVGVLVLALALYEIWDIRRHSGHPA